MDTTKEYKVFISYSWTNETHMKWVLDLATRLQTDGVEVRLDKWELSAGHDKYVFMESMVKDEHIDKVLMICDKRYKDKADNREGGVGTETQIITPELYENTNQNKFIPIIAEQGEKFDSFLPLYLKSRIAIDMSSEEVYEKGYEELIRLIYEKPQYRKPLKGQPPSYLFEDEKPHLKTNLILKQLKNCLINKPQQVNYFVNDFVLEFKNSLNQYQISLEEFNDLHDEVIINNINDLTLLRNDYIEFIQLLSSLNKHFNIDIITTLFEDIYSYTEVQDNSSYNQLQFDHYKFFIMEIFLYTTAILIENDLFEKLNEFLGSAFFIKTKFTNDKHVDFVEFRFYIQSLDSYRNSRLKLNRVSVTADLLVQRSIINNKNYKQLIIDADLLLYFISVIKKGNERYSWYPTTYIYKNDSRMEIIRRLISKRHFEKVKVLFGINSIENMKKIVSEFTNKGRGYQNSFESIPSIQNYIKPEEIGSYQ